MFVFISTLHLTESVGRRRAESPAALKFRPIEVRAWVDSLSESRNGLAKWAAFPHLLETFSN